MSAIKAVLVNKEHLETIIGYYLPNVKPEVCVRLAGSIIEDVEPIILATARRVASQEREKEYMRSLLED